MITDSPRLFLYRNSLRCSVFRGIFLTGRSPALPATLTPEICLPLSISVQKYCFFLTYANFTGKK